MITAVLIRDEIYAFLWWYVPNEFDHWKLEIEFYSGYYSGKYVKSKLSQVVIHTFLLWLNEKKKKKLYRMLGNNKIVV